MPSSSKKPNAKAGPSKGAARPREEIAIDLEYDDDDASSEVQLQELLEGEDMALPEGLPAEMWRRSPSPIEFWEDAEGAGEDGSWPVRIVGEEVDASGKVRYEIEWETWRRQDGTNTTWNIEDIYPDDKRRTILREWNRKQAKKRKKLADDSLNIEITPAIDVHNNRTRYRAQAYDEKHAIPLNSDNDVITRYAEEKAKEAWYLRENPDEEWESEGEKRRSKRQRSAKTVTVSTAGSRAPSSATLKSLSASQSHSRASSSTSVTRLIATPTIASTSRKSAPSSRAPSSSTWPSSANASNSHARASSTTSATRPTPTPSVSSTLTSLSGRSTPGTYRFLTPAASSVTLVSQSPSLPGRPFDSVPAGPPMSEKARGKQPVRNKAFSPPPPPRPARPVGLSPREALAREWSSHGARIYICNDIDDESIPPLPRGFEYLEKGYKFDTGLEYLKGDPGFLMGCTGHGSCNTKAMGRCDCQDESNLKGPSGVKICAYDSKGLFRFNVPRGVEVLECTPNCECSVNSCPNRILQRDRDVPLEVFKTSLRGWGVRAMTEVAKGKVLGMYTGLLIRRQDAKDKMDYCFDLDGQEDLSDGAVRSQEDSYSVDSESVGNWTRFINHSCDPNLIVYEVVYDQPPGQGIPYLAYAVLRDIKPGEELRFNYNPTMDDEDDQSRKKGKSVKYWKTASGKRIPSGLQECHCGAAICRGYF